jgi:hypothetical protein
MENPPRILGAHPKIWIDNLLSIRSAKRLKHVAILGCGLGLRWRLHALNSDESPKTIARRDWAGSPLVRIAPGK